MTFLESLCTTFDLIHQLRDGHAHLTPAQGHEQIAVVRLTPALDFDGWGWVATPNGRRDVHTVTALTDALTNHRKAAR